MASPAHMIEARGELIPHPEERGATDWMVRLTLARLELIDPATQQPHEAPQWREIDHTVVNYHGFDYGGKTLLDLQRALFDALEKPTAVRTIVQRAGDVLTLDWQDAHDGVQFGVTDDRALSAAGALIEESRLTLARCGLIGG